MPLPAYKDAPKIPRPEAKYLPVGPTPRSANEELDRLLAVLPEDVAEGPFATWVWRWDGPRREWGKLPLDPLSPTLHARSTDPRTCSSLENAVGARFRFGLPGICRLLVDGEGLLGGDLDHVWTPAGGLAPLARETLAALPCYAEESPGDGVRFFLPGVFPEAGRRGRKHGDVELYGAHRLLTVTGRVLQAGGDVCRAALRAWYARHFPAPPPDPGLPAPAWPAKPTRALRLTDRELLERARSARNGAWFDALWRGDCRYYGGDRSRADLALCRSLHFWTGGDRVRIDRLFRQSGLMRRKWDEPRGDRTYGQRTIEHMCLGGAAR